jgi:PAS domain-containing protein
MAAKKRSRKASEETTSKEELQSLIEELGKVKNQLQDKVEELESAHNNVRKSEEQLAAVLHTAVDAIITINATGIIQSVNTATERMFGYTAAELIGNKESQRKKSAREPPLTRSVLARRKDPLGLTIKSGSRCRRCRCRWSRRGCT